MKLRVLIVALFASLLSGPAALAAGGGSAVHGYAGQAGVVQSQVQSSSSLPFTGIDLMLLVGGGLLLVLLGVGLRWFAHPRVQA